MLVFSFIKKFKIFSKPVIDNKKQSKLEVKAEQREYKYEFALFTGSFIRDLKRCFFAYQSFEKFFLNPVPYFICVPENDLKNFESYFYEKLSLKEIKELPNFLTERQVLEMAGEPVEEALQMKGYYLQDCIRLCFGLTGIAKHYLMNDSDGYFIKDFDKKHLYQNGKLKFIFHECWHEPKTAEQMSLLDFGHGNKEFINLKLSYFDLQKTIKCLLNHDDNNFHNYTCTPSAFDSDVLCDMKNYLIGCGLKNYTNIIRMIPFAFQWYGEYLAKSRKLIPMPFLFFCCEPPVEVWKVKKSFFDDPNKYGIQYQSVDYGKGGIAHDRVSPTIVYQDE